MRNIVEVAGWIIVAAIAVLVVMNADNAAKVISAGSQAVTSETSLLTGSGYQKAA